MKLDIRAYTGCVVPFFVHLATRFWRDRCPMVASELAYTTLLALVPLMAVGFSVLAAFPVFQHLITDIQNFIFQSFVPAFGEVVERYLLEFARQASGLTALGIVALVTTALMMMGTIERSLNDIWGARPRRRILSSFLVYWAVLTLGPMLVGTSLAVTSYLVSLPLFTDSNSEEVRGYVIRLLPFLSTTLAFGLLYVVVPNRIIPVRNALVGALIAAMLFDLANRAFAIYVTQYASYQKVYGALAAIPVFLVWIYVSWVVILLGAEITHSLTTFRISMCPDNGADGSLELVYAFRVLGHLWLAQTDGKGLSLAQLLKLEPMLPERTLDGLMERLHGARLVQRTAEGRWVLARDMSELTLLQLYRSLPFVLPTPGDGWAGQDHWNQALHGVLTEGSQCLEDALRVPLKALYLRKLDE